MIPLVRWLWGRVKAVAGLVLPMLGTVAGGVRPWLFWIVHVVVIAAILGGLFWLNRYFELPKYLEAPTAWLAEVWLPLLFLLLYLNLWAGYWLWRVLRPAARLSPFPDIDAAWAASLSAYRAAGFDLTRTPLFLVLGRPRGGPGAIFDAANLKATPHGTLADPPLQLYATRDAAYLVCPGCSLMGGLADWAGRMTDRITEPITPTGPTAMTDVPSLSDAAADVTADEQPTDEPIPLARNPAEIDRLTARLRHLGFLVRDARLPYAPINGVMVLTPEATTRSPSRAHQAGHFAAADLATVADVMQVRVPTVAVVVDAEDVPGLPDFLDRIPAGKRGQRLGRRIPYVPRLNAVEREKLVGQAVRWVSSTLVPRLVYRVMPIDGDPAEPTRLFQLIAGVAGRREALSRFFAQTLAPDDNPAVLPGGCYLAATGPTAARQGFLTDVFAQLVESQNFLAWTPAGLAEERSLRRRIALGYAVLVTLLLTAIGLTVYWFVGR